MTNKKQVTDFFRKNLAIYRIIKSLYFNPLSAKHNYLNGIYCFWSASVDNRPLPGAWVAEFLGVIVAVQDQ